MFVVVLCVVLSGVLSGVLCGVLCGVVCGVLCGVVWWWWCVVLVRTFSTQHRTPFEEPPPPDHPKFRSFFPSPTPCSLLLSLSGWSFLGILVVFLKRWGLKCACLGFRVVV